MVRFHYGAVDFVRWRAITLVHLIAPSHSSWLFPARDRGPSWSNSHGSESKFRPMLMPVSLEALFSRPAWGGNWRGSVFHRSTLMSFCPLGISNSAACDQESLRPTSRSES